MKNILVTGAAGYIGSHVCQQLKANKFGVVGIDNFSRGNRFVGDALQIPIIETDIADETKLSKILKDYKIDGVMHLAAFAYVGESMDDPFLYYDNNINHSIKFFEVLEKNSINKIVFSSSCAIYGIPEKLPLTEDAEKNPINPYGLSKLICEKILESLCLNRGFSVASLRYFNVGGSDPAAIIGETHIPETHLIPRLIESAHDGSVFQINGNDFDTPDGTCVRDFIHVLDIADAHLKAFNYLESKCGYSAFNLANQKSFSIMEIINAVERNLEVKIKTEVSKKRAGDPDILMGDYSLAKEKLNWNPLNSDINKMIIDSWRWFKKCHQ
jgi:UDP-glucose-4-epimerase GalE